MTKKVTTVLVDDLDGTLPADETVEFAIDRYAFEIDLSSGNAAELRKALNRYVANARKKGRTRLTATRSVTAPLSGLPLHERNRIREWGRKNGHKVGDKGRVARNVLDAYYEAIKK